MGHPQYGQPQHSASPQQPKHDDVTESMRQAMARQFIGRSAVVGPQPGAALIAAERERHLAMEGWTAQHDDKYDRGELVHAAMCYADIPAVRSLKSGGGLPLNWPWSARWWKPTPDDRIRELVKAGALIAAEIDRLQRLQEASKCPSVKS